MSCYDGNNNRACSIQFLKMSKYVVSERLAKLINLSVQTGKYPTKLKIAKIIPIFEENDNTEPSSYRPISLLSIFNRLFEKIMYNRLVEFMEKNDLLSNSQYGFRKHHATHHAILDIMNQIHSNFDNKLYTCSVFLDLKKAFDTLLQYFAEKTKFLLYKRMYERLVCVLPLQYITNYFMQSHPMCRIGSKSHMVCHRALF